MTLVSAEVLIIGQLLVGQALHQELVIVQKTFPGGIPQRGRADEQHPLASLPVLADQPPSGEGFTQAHPIGDEHPAVFAQDPPSSPNPMELEGGDRDATGILGFLGDLAVIELPEDLQKNQIWRILGEKLLVQGCQIERLGFSPKLLVPVLYAFEKRVAVMPEVEL